MKRGRNFTVRERKEILKARPELDITQYLLGKIYSMKGGNARFTLIHKDTYEEIDVIVDWD